MHLYLRLVNEGCDSIVEQASEVGFHSEEVGVYSCGVSEISNNPDTTSKPRSIQPLPCVLTNIIHLSLLFGALSTIGVN